MSILTDEIARRRTFAIISHPDAGKTTLTEKLLLFGGAIQLAGEVKARGDRRRARSDWMAIERERGISVSSAVMTFEHEGLTFNLLDTPGHQDFSEDTYRTLTAVDSAVMVLDSAKGIEEQTRKLFEVCRLRDVPILTFVNKLDRESRDPFDLLDEIEQSLALDVTPASWPIGMGRDFLGTYDLFANALLLFERNAHDRVVEPVRCSGLDDPELLRRLPKAAVAKLREEVEMARGLCPPFDPQAFREGHLTPVFFGSALNNFGVRELLHGVAELAPPPRPQPALGADGPYPIPPDEPDVAGFVFKVQANVDPQHRDRVAFVRLASGRFSRGMKLKNVRTGRVMSVQAPVFFLARERNLAEEAWPGDIIGIPNHGSLRIGDTLTEGAEIRSHRHSELCPRDPAPGASRRPDEVEASAPRARTIGRGGGDPGVQAGLRRRLDCRRGRRAPARRAGRAAAGRIRSRHPARRCALSGRALARSRRPGRDRAVPGPQSVRQRRGP